MSEIEKGSDLFEFLYLLISIPVRQQKGRPFSSPDTFIQTVQATTELRVLQRNMRTKHTRKALNEWNEVPTISIAKADSSFTIAMGGVYINSIIQAGLLLLVTTFTCPQFLLLASSFIWMKHTGWTHRVVLEMWIRLSVKRRFILP